MSARDANGDQTPIRARIKAMLPAEWRRQIRRLVGPSRRRLLACRLTLAELVLPKGFFLQMLPNEFVHLPRFSGFEAAQRRYNDDTSAAYCQPIADGNRVLSLFLLLASVEELPRGDYAEVGTWRGHSARIIFERKAEGSELHCFDTFEGFDRRDVSIERPHDHAWMQVGHFADTSLDLVQRYVVGDRPDASALRLHKGFFPNTFAGLEDLWWRFVHLDADLYAPTYAALERFYPHLVPGGIIVIHDYNNSMYYEGAVKAVNEYFRPLGIVPIALPDKAGSAVIIKPALTPPDVLREAAPGTSRSES